MKKRIASLMESLNFRYPNQLKRNFPLSYLTSIKIGGPADLLFTAQSKESLKESILLARQYDIPVTILGGGTNVLISDKGIRGLVIRNMSSHFEILGKVKSGIKIKKQQARWNSDNAKGTFRGIDFRDLNYDESELPQVRVLMDSGVSLSGIIYKMIESGLTGLQWYAGIPGTIGGAVHNNIHGGEHFFSELIEEVEIMTLDNRILKMSYKDLGLDYDKSRFHQSGEIILTVKLRLYLGDVKRAKFTADEWKKRKKIQPRNSPGCVFKNITLEDKNRLGYPTTSIGYLVEHILKMLGYRSGDIGISQVHGNFIINHGKASARDFLKVVRELKKRAYEIAGLDLEPEIFFLGFDKNELKGVTY